MTSIQEAMTKLYIHAQESMKPDELDDVANTMLCQAATAARNLSVVTEGIGCLVANDGMSDDRSGNFQDADDVFRLMWSISQQADMISALIWVSTEARLKARSKEAALTTG